MWLKKLKKKKLQCFLIGALIFLSSLIFATGFSIITSVNNYVSEYYSNDKFYELVFLNANEKSKNDVFNWCKDNSVVEDLKVIDAFTSGNDLYRNGEKLKLSMYDIMPLDDMENVAFGLSKVSSLNENPSPKEGEIWITRVFADTYNIALGDTLTIKTKTKDISLKVTALVNDSLQPSSTSGIITLYISKEVEESLSSFERVEFFFIDIKKDFNVVDIQKDLTSAVEVGGFAMDKDTLILSATFTSTMMGGASTLASVLIFVVSLFVIRFMIWNNILKEYKSIGIYKALGFSKKEIQGFYIIGYSVAVFIGSILGALCSIPILNYTASKILKYVGAFESVKINYPIILATIILFTLLVIFNLYFVIRRTNKISPIDALRTGITSSRKKLTKSLIKNSTSPLILAINDMFKYKKSTISITLALTLSLTLVLIFGNVNVTMSKMKENSHIWFGIPKSDITISSSMTASGEDFKDVMKEIKEDTRVKNYGYGSMISGAAKLDTKKYPIKSTLYNVMVMNSYNSDLGFTIIEGHNPENYNEAAVSLKILKETGLAVGDYIELTINDKKDSYLISGSYTSMMSNGYGIRLLSSTIERENPEFKGSEIFVNLKTGMDKESFKEEINEKYCYLDASDMHPMLQYTVDSIPGTVLPITYLLIVVFTVFSAITILNIIITNIRDNIRNFGIMKALGFTYKDIRNRYLYRILILTAFSSIISVLLNVTVGPPLIAEAFNGSDVLIISTKTMIILLTAMVALIIVTTLICCQAIKNTKPNELMEE